MRLSYKWLSEYVDLSGVTPEELAEKMTTAGLALSRWRRARTSSSVK